MNLIRKYKLYLLDIYEDDEKRFFDHLHKLFSDLNKVTINNKEIYYKNKKYIFYLNYKFNSISLNVEYYDNLIKLFPKYIKDLYVKECILFIINTNYNINMFYIFRIIDKSFIDHSIENL